MIKPGMGTLAVAAAKHGTQAAAPHSYPAYTAGVVVVAVILLIVLAVSVGRTLANRRPAYGSQRSTDEDRTWGPIE